MTMGAALGLEKSHYSHAFLYARVLALNERGGKILRVSENVRSIAILSKPAAARDLDEETLTRFELSASAHDLYVLAYSDVKKRIGEKDWTTSPLFIKDVME